MLKVVLALNSTFIMITLSELIHFLTFSHLKPSEKHLNFLTADVGADWKPIIERANIPPNLIKSRENIVPFLHLTHNLSCHIFFSGIQKIRIGIITLRMKRKHLLVCHKCHICMYPKTLNKCQQ